MKLRVGRLGLLALVISAWSRLAYGGADPTPAEIAAGWKRISGGLQARAVYWKANAIWTLDLLTGRAAKVLEGVRRVRGESAVGPYPVWSPDAKRIVFFDPGPPRQYKVMNADGSNVKTILSSTPWTYGPCSWWSASETNDWVAVLADGPGYKVIKRIRVGPDNSPGEVVTVVGSAPYGGKGREWISMSGDYVAWTDWGANARGQNRCVVRNWKTGKELEVVPRAKDACSIVLKPDGSGTSLYCPNWHGEGAAKAFDGKLLFHWTPVDGKGLIEMLRWSNHSDFICHMDNRQMRNPTTQRTWIRKATRNGKPFLFLGYGIWGADLWVNTGPAPEPKRAGAPPKRAVVAKPPAPSPEKEAAKKLRPITQMLRHKQFARQNRSVIEARLKELVKAHPGTDAAERAQELLDEGW